MGKRPEQTFLQRRYTDGQQTHEKMFKIINNQGNANQNYNEISPHARQDGYNQQDRKQPVLERMWREGNSDTLLVAVQTGAATMENSMEIPQKIKDRTTV